MRKPKATRKVAAKKAKPAIEPAQQDFSHDPYFIPADQIPKGWEYQWFCIAVNGIERDPRIIAIETKDWRAVPRTRHKQYSGFRHIVLDGLKLYERRIPKDRPALTEANLAAIKQYEEHPAHPKNRKVHPHHSTLIMPEEWNESETYDRVPNDATLVKISVSVPFALHARFQDAANALKLTLEQYAQRRILLYLRGEIDGMLLPVDGALELIEPSFNLTMNPKRN